MKKDGSSFGHRKNVLNALKYYCEMKSILNLNWRKIRRYLGEATIAFPDTREYHHEEIKKLLGVADPKYRAIILIFASSGMRLEPLTEIRLKDMEYLENYKIYKIKIYKGTRQQQICFTTPEAAAAIKDYFKLNNIDEKGPGYFHHVSPHAVSKQISKLCVKAKMREVAAGAIPGTTRTSVPAVHGFRRFCITQMAKAGVELEKRKLLTGHTIGVETSYARYSEDDLLQEYLKAVNLLTISEENRLRIKVEQLTVEKSALDEIKKLKLVVEDLQKRRK